MLETILLCTHKIIYDSNIWNHFIEYKDNFLFNIL